VQAEQPAVGLHAQPRLGIVLAVVVLLGGGDRRIGRRLGAVAGVGELGIEAQQIGRLAQRRERRRAHPEPCGVASR
jgi:hypothetical protein